MLECILDPVKSQPKETFVKTLCSINQMRVVLGNHLQALADHPNIGKTSGNQQTADASRIGQVTLVNVEASAVLVGKEGFNSKTSPIISASQIGVLHVGDEGVAWCEGLSGLYAGFGLKVRYLDQAAIEGLTRSVLNPNLEYAH